MSNKYMQLRALVDKLFYDISNQYDDQESIEDFLKDLREFMYIKTKDDGHFDDIYRATKERKCYGCGKTILVPKDYEPNFCCTGRDCCCGGEPINPTFCEECEEKYFGKKE